MMTVILRWCCCFWLLLTLPLVGWGQELKGDYQLAGKERRYVFETIHFLPGYRFTTYEFTCTGEGEGEGTYTLKNGVLTLHFTAHPLAAIWAANWGEPKAEVKELPPAPDSLFRLRIRVLQTWDQKPVIEPRMTIAGVIGEGFEEIEGDSNGVFNFAPRPQPKLTYVLFDEHSSNGFNYPKMKLSLPSPGYEVTIWATPGNRDLVPAGTIRRFRVRKNAARKTELIEETEERRGLVFEESPAAP